MSASVQLFGRQIDPPPTLAADLDRHVDPERRVRRVARHGDAEVGVEHLAGGADGRLANRPLPPRRFEAQVARRREIERRLIGERARHGRLGLRVRGPDQSNGQ